MAPKNTAQGISCLILIGVFLAGCGHDSSPTLPSSTTQSPPSDEPPPPVQKLDPVASIAELVKIVPSAATQYPNSGGKKAWFENIRYDVRKTDSLISPFSGIVTFKISLTGSDGKTHYLNEVTAHLAWQDERWVYQKSEGNFYVDGSLRTTGKITRKIDLVRNRHPEFEPAIQHFFGK